MEAPQEAPPATDYSLRPRRTMDQPCTGHGAPGKQALQAAHAYLSGEYDSPALAAEAACVDRQLVNYYVRKLAAQVWFVRNALLRVP